MTDSHVIAKALKLGKEISEILPRHPTLRSAFLEACIEKDYLEYDEPPEMFMESLQWVQDHDEYEDDAHAVQITLGNLRIELTQALNRETAI